MGKRQFQEELLQSSRGLAFLTSNLCTQKYDTSFYKWNKFLFEYPFLSVAKISVEPSQPLPPPHTQLCSGGKVTLTYSPALPLSHSGGQDALLLAAPGNPASCLGSSSQTHHFYFCFLGNSLLPCGHPPPPLPLYCKSPRTSEESYSKLEGGENSVPKLSSWPKRRGHLLNCWRPMSFVSFHVASDLQRIH